MIDHALELDELLKRLAQTLDDEFLALTSRDPEQLLNAVAEKTELLAELTQMNTERDVLQHSTLRQLTVEHPPLRETLDLCAQRNRINGGAIAVNRSLVSGLLTTLLGTPARQSLYDAAGRVAGDSTPREVGRV